jgi:MFS superfamily sulfate permease-like transporter
MIAIKEAFRAGLFTRKNFIKNTLAGLIVGIVALPLSMAFAIASGARPENGIYTAIVAGLLVGVFGGTRAQIAGPTGAFIDYSGLSSFQETIEKLYKRNIMIYLVGVNERIEDKFKSVGLLELVADKRVFDNLAEIIDYDNQQPFEGKAL